MVGRFWSINNTDDVTDIEDGSVHIFSAKIHWSKPTALK